MTDKAPEAALLPCPFCGGEAHIVERDVEPQGDPWYGKRDEKFVECPKCSACIFDGYWHEGFIEDEQAIAAWNRRAPLSALPGEAEVVMEQIAHKEQIGIWANELTSALSLSDFLREDWSFDDSVDLEKEVAAQLLDIIRSAITHPGLNLVASLEAMQARAEKAERERDEWRNHVMKQNDNVAHNLFRAEAAEARVKELEEALAPAQLHVEQLSELLKIIREHWIDYDHVFSIAVHEADDWVKSRTALTGGSNG